MMHSADVPPECTETPRSRCVVLAKMQANCQMEPQFVSPRGLHWDCDEARPEHETARPQRIFCGDPAPEWQRSPGFWLLCRWVEVDGLQCTSICVVRAKHWDLHYLCAPECFSSCLKETTAFNTSAPKYSPTLWMKTGAPIFLPQIPFPCILGINNDFLQQGQFEDITTKSISSTRLCLCVALMGC